MSGARRSPLGPPVQIAYGVTGLRAAAERFAAATGAGAFTMVEHVELAAVRRGGEPGGFDHSSAYGQWGAMMVELVEEHTPPLAPPWSGIHHLAFMVESLDHAADWCASQGWPELLRAETVGGQEFAFHDARTGPGHLVELYEPTERLLAFYRSVAEAATGWTDGRTGEPPSTTGA